jgi:hypothetical protein
MSLIDNTESSTVFNSSSETPPDDDTEYSTQPVNVDEIVVNKRVINGHTVYSPSEIGPPPPPETVYRSGNPSGTVYQSGPSPSLPTIYPLISGINFVKLLLGIVAFLYIIFFIQIFLTFLF